jgi:hypothetical protein
MGLRRHAVRRTQRRKTTDYDRSAVAFPNDGVKFQPGNPGKPRNAAPISRRRARKMAAAAIVAEASGAHAPDFDGDALAYLQAVYTGRVKPDALRMSAAIAATKFEKPSLSASLTATVGNSSATTPLGIVMLPVKDADDSNGK